jgi:uncharacterized protein
VILLASLAVVHADSLTRINALKQTVSLVVNTAAAVVFVFSKPVDWPICGVMLVASLGGGVIGGAIASKVKPAVLRWMVVVGGTSVAVAMFARW